MRRAKENCQALKLEIELKIQAKKEEI